MSGLVALAFPLMEKGLTAGDIFFIFMFASLATVWFYNVRLLWGKYLNFISTIVKGMVLCP